MNTHHTSSKKGGSPNEEKEQKRGGEKNLSSLLTSYFEKTRITDTSSTNHAALLAWYRVAGVAEKEHTTGVFVVPAKYNQPPKLMLIQILCVLIVWLVERYIYKGLSLWVMSFHVLSLNFRNIKRSK